MYFIYTNPGRGWGDSLDRDGVPVAEDERHGKIAREYVCRHHRVVVNTFGRTTDATVALHIQGGNTLPGTQDHPLKKAE